MDAQSAATPPTGVLARLRAILAGSSEASLTKRLAAAIHIIRGHGAAAATSISLALEAVPLFWIVRQRLGRHVLAFGKSSA